MKTAKSSRGFTLLYAVLISSVLLAIGIAIFEITVRELRLSSVIRESQYAFYAADAGVECVLHSDFKFNGSQSAFAGSPVTAGSGAAGEVVVYLTSGSSWTVPANWNSSSNIIEAIGGGSYGAGFNSGGGGGAYAKIFNLALTPGASIPYQVGEGGSRTVWTPATGSWFRDTDTLHAQAGSNASGGSGAISRGSVTFSGGNGGTGWLSGGGGGGAAGTNGDGNNGAAPSLSNAGGKGGSGDADFGGEGGDGVLNGAGEPGGDGAGWDSTHGSGGGGGGGGRFTGAGGVGGLYGGGGGGGGVGGNPPGNGAQGIIVIRYTPSGGGSGSSSGGTSLGASSGVFCGTQDIAADGTKPSPYQANVSTWAPWSVTTSGNTYTTVFYHPIASDTRCAILSVVKTVLGGGSVRTVVESRGYNVSCGSIATDSNAVERTLRVSY